MVRLPSWLTEPVLLAFVTILLLLPYCGKPFFVDDPLFVWAGENIARHPLDPFGFNVNWYGTSEPMWYVTENPPLACYYIGAVGGLFGFSELALHLAFLMPAVALTLGTYQLSRRFVQRPLLCGAIALASPAFFVSATSVMSDVPMAALLTWACVFWLRGFQSGKGLDYGAAGLLLSLAFVTKYFAILLLPVWLIHGLARRPAGWRWLWAVALPPLAVAAYEAWTRHLYGAGLFHTATAYANWARSNSHNPLAQNLLEGLAYDGGCVLPIVLLAPALWGKRLPYFILGLVPVLIALWYFGGPGKDTKYSAFNSLDDWTHGWTAAQGAVLLLGGFGLPALLVWAAGKTFRKNPDGPRPEGSAASTNDIWFLLGWVAVTFVFGTELNWTLSARSSLPMIPPLATLIGMRLEARSLSSRALWTPIALCAALTLAITQGDWVQANSERTEAKIAVRAVAPKAHAIWCMGAWGFAYYLNQLGARTFDSETSRVNVRDYFLTATNVANTQVPADGIAEGSFPTKLNAFASTMNYRNDAGFYSTEWGQLPFSFFPEPGSETCTVYGLDLAKIRAELRAPANHR